MTFVYNHNILRMKARLRELERELDERLREKAKLEKAIALLKEHGLARTDDNKEKRVPISTRKAEIRLVVAEQPGIRVGDLAELLGVTSQRVVQIVNVMTDDGEIERRPGGGLKTGNS